MRLIVAVIMIAVAGPAAAQGYQPIGPNSFNQQQPVVVAPATPTYNGMMMPGQPPTVVQQPGQVPTTTIPQTGQVYRAQPVTPPGRIPNANMYNNGQRQ